MRAGNDHVPEYELEKARRTLTDYNVLWHRGINSGALFTSINHGNRAEIFTYVTDALTTLGLSYSAMKADGDHIITVTGKNSTQRLEGILKSQGHLLDEHHEPTRLDPLEGKGEGAARG
ncbi:MAG: hypothetical protein MRY32_06645 [Rickettsiales bacterium]|nr:hypothetical protein [Rickettsiales bacterium]